MAERFDLDAIAADDALLDLLAAGDASAFGGLGEVEDDPAIHLLAELRLAVEVDEPSFEMVDDADSFLAACAARSQDPFARRIATRTLAGGIAALALLSVSGVAAAVTGDPLSPYEKVIERVVDEFSPRSSFPVRSLDGVVGSKAKGIKANKAAKDYVREQTAAETVVQPTVAEDLLANRLNTPQRVPPRVPPKTETKVPPPLKQEPTEVEPSQPVETEQPPETQPSQPVEPENPPQTQQPTTQPTATPTPTPTTATTTPEQPGGEETTGNENGSQGTQGSDNGPSGNQHTPDPQPSTAPTQVPSGGQPTGEDSGDAGSTDDGSNNDGKPNGDENGKPDGNEQGKPNGDENGKPGDDEESPADDPFAAALIRSLLAVLNGVMVTPRG